MTPSTGLDMEITCWISASWRHMSSLSAARRPRPPRTSHPVWMSCAVEERPRCSNLEQNVSTVGKERDERDILRTRFEALWMVCQHKSVLINDRCHSAILGCWNGSGKCGKRKTEPWEITSFEAKPSRFPNCLNSQQSTQKSAAETSSSPEEAAIDLKTKICQVGLKQKCQTRCAKLITPN